MRATATGQELSSSEARAVILSQHASLREQVSETLTLAEGAGSTRRELDPLQTRARGLYEAFTAHMELEERVLAIALADVIGWGGELIREIERDHERQRADLHAALRAVERETARVGGGLIASVQRFSATLLGALDREERLLLTADVDAMIVDGRGG
jgi:hypothetical protein